MATTFEQAVLDYATTNRERLLEQLHAPSIPEAEHREAFPDPTEADVDAEYEAMCAIPVIGLTVEDQLDGLTELRVHYAKLASPYEEKIKALEAERDSHCLKVREAIERVEGTVRLGTLMRGATVRGRNLQAVWSRGRVSWDDKFLSGFAVAHPEVLPARKQGDPSVSIRELKP
jgi:hypothetical protein